MITCTTDGCPTKDLKPYKVSTLGAYEFTSVMSKALVGILASEIETTEKLSWTEKLGAGNPVTYVQAFLNDYMYTVLKFKKVYSPNDYNSFWKPKFMEYGYSPNMTDFMFTKFYAAYSKNLVPKDIWTGTAYGALPGEGPADAGTDKSDIIKYAAGGTGILIALGVGAYLLFFRK